MLRLVHPRLVCFSLLASLWAGCQASVDRPQGDKDDDGTMPVDETPGPTKPLGMGGGAAGAGGTTGGSGGGGGGGSAGNGGSKADAGTSDAGVDPVKADAGVVAPDGPMVAPSIIPVIYLDIPGKTPDNLSGDTKSLGKMRIIEDHDGTHKDLAMKKATVDTKVGVSKRGSSSGGFPQKSFSIEIHDSADMQAKLALLGMPAGEDWAAVACWTDKPCMRNMLAYEMGRAMGQWAPRGRFAEIYFNNQYQGLYQFAEAPKQGKGRLDLPKPADSTAAGDLTGGYIFRREAGGKAGPSGKRDWLSPTKAPDMYGHQQVYTFHYPNEKTITPDQKKYITGYMQKFEEMMKDVKWNDPADGYRAWIDVQSWADFALIQEVSNNVDGYWKSMYMTKLKDDQGKRGKMLMTPFWDFNIAFGNADYRDGWKLDNFMFKMNRLGGECTDFMPKAPPVCDVGCCTSTCKTGGKCWNIPYIPFWWDKLWAEQAFLKDLKCRYQDLRKNGPLTPAFIDQKLGAWKAQIRPNAVARHYKKWGDLRKYVWPNPCQYDDATKAFKTNTKFKQAGLPDPNCSSPTLSPEEFLDGETKWLREWTVKRLEWPDKNLPGTCN